MITEDEIKDLNYLFEECKDIMEDGYATIKLSLVKKLFDYYRGYSRKEAKQKKKYESVLDEIREYINNYDVFKEFSFPLMKRDEENQVKSSIDYEFQTSIKKSLLQILDKVKE